MSVNVLKENEVKQIMVEVLEEIKEYCESVGIQFFLYAGTLLGAVRHNGFIPWDDDIDILMFREDYEKFISGFKSKSGKVKIISRYLDKNCKYLFSKAVDDTTVLIENENAELSIGVFVDIFPLDSLCDDLNECKKALIKARKLQVLHQMKYMCVRKGRHWTKNAFLILSRPILKMFPDKFFFDRINRIADKYKKNKNSKYVANLFGAWCEREITLRENFTSAVELEFEGGKFPAPKGYDAYLCDLYGDYMKLPPKEKQVTHHDYIAYRKEI